MTLSEKYDFNVWIKILIMSIISCFINGLIVYKEYPSLIWQQKACTYQINI